MKKMHLNALFDFARSQIFDVADSDLDQSAVCISFILATSLEFEGRLSIN